MKSYEHYSNIISSLCQETLWHRIEGLHQTRQSIEKLLASFLKNFNRKSSVLTGVTIVLKWLLLTICLLHFRAVYLLLKGDTCHECPCFIKFRENSLARQFPRILAGVFRIHWLIGGRNACVLFDLISWAFFSGLCPTCGSWAKFLDESTSETTQLTPASFNWPFDLPNGGHCSPLKRSRAKPPKRSRTEEPGNWFLTGCGPNLL